MTDKLDEVFLDIAKTAARRTLDLIAQGKIQGYEKTQPTSDNANLLTPAGMNSLIGRGLSDLAGHEQSYDAETWMVYLGAALGLIPHDLLSWKSLLYESPAVCGILHDVFQLLVERRVLVPGASDEYRLPWPEERWFACPPGARRPPDDLVQRLYLESDLHALVDQHGHFLIYEAQDGCRQTVRAVPAYPSGRVGRPRV